MKTSIDPQIYKTHFIVVLQTFQRSRKIYRQNVNNIDLASNLSAH